MTLIFSTTDDSNNQGSAKINTKQRLLSKKWIADAFAIINLSKRI
jgi:hypothetical protein